jgi:hypothetical protein
MKPASDHDPLERLIDKTLREQPPRRAPASLELQVFAAIERRNARAWWRKNFAYWPLAARAAFILICAVVMKFAVDASMWVIAGLDSTAVVAELAAQVAWLKMLVIVVASIMRNVPAPWIYAGLAALAAMYAAVFGLGTVAYRTLYVNR